MRKFSLCVFVLSLRYVPVLNLHRRPSTSGHNFEVLLKEHIESNVWFADKTLLIREFLTNPDQRIVITRPRRWGKSLNLDMLYTFLTVETDDFRYKKLFAEGDHEDGAGTKYKFPKLRISNYPDAMTHQGSHPTLYIDLSTISFDSDLNVDSFNYEFCKCLADTVDTRYAYLKNRAEDADDSLTKIEKRRLARFFNRTLNDRDVPYVIPLIIKMIYRRFNNTPVYVLIDEYESPINKVYSRYGADSRVFQAIWKSVKNIFGVAFKHDQPHLGKVLLTGVWSIVRGDLGVDNFTFYTAAEDGKFSEYYGFTETEVEDFLSQVVATSEEKSKILDWYNGYVSGGKVIYNPWSITRCLASGGQIANYWVATCPQLDRDTKKAILSGNITKNYNHLVGMKALESHQCPKDLKYTNLSGELAALALLLDQGYLTISGRNGTTVYYKIPNLEVKSVYEEEHRKYIESTRLKPTTVRKSSLLWPNSQWNEPIKSPARWPNDSIPVDGKPRWFSGIGIVPHLPEPGAEDENGESRSSGSALDEDDDDGTPFNKTEVVNNLVTEFGAVFDEKIGTVPNFRATLRMRQNATPKFVEPRKVPNYLAKIIDAELSAMEEAGIISKTNHSEWATPLVPLVQNGKKLRICGDYKVTINPDLIDEDYRIPMIHDIFHKMKHGRFFCTLDVYKAYLHVRVDEKSAEIQTINTQNGLYRVHRMMFGSKNAPKIFQRLMDTMLEGLDGTAAFFDDVIVQGRTARQTTERVRKVLQRLQRYDMHLNLKKCKFFETSVKYLGHRIDEKGKHKLQDKVDAILTASRPQSVTQLKSFLGLVHYYGKFVKNLSSVLHSLNKLLHKNTTYQWSESCERSFVSVKNSIAEQSFLVPYDPKLPLLLATDASAHAIGVVLSHIRDGRERPIEFASKSLNNCELRYSLLDKKAAAIYWALKKFYQFCYGRRFTLITDSEPLNAILNAETKRMKRYAQYLSGFTFDVRYRNATDGANTNFLSEFPGRDATLNDTSVSSEARSGQTDSEG